MNNNRSVTRSVFKGRFVLKFSLQNCLPTSIAASILE